jgi:Domain of unknown function (DUF4124)
MRDVKSAAFILAVVVCAPVQAQTYKCVDQHGATRYSDTPLPNCKNEVISTKRSGAAPAAPAPASAREAAKTVQQLNATCSRSMQEYSRLAATRPDPSASDEARQNRLNALREQLRGCG